MARRNMFKSAPPDGIADEPTLEGVPARFPATSPMKAMRSSLAELSANAIRDIAPDLIEDSKHADRLPFTAGDIVDLKKSIAAHGQQIPILVRPLSQSPERYEVVYGRRRLAALRELGRAARAIVRTMDDTEALIAQGHENSVRLDPSFVEKALFARTLQEAGYKTQIVAEALGTDRTIISRMVKVVTEVPINVIEAIGPAHDIGRRGWLELADLLVRARQANAPPLDQILRNLEGIQDSSDRFRYALEATTKLVLVDQEALPADGLSEPQSGTKGEGNSPPAPSKPTKTHSKRDESSGRTITASEDGRMLGRIQHLDQFVSISIPMESEEFACWLDESAEAILRELHARWREKKRSGSNLTSQQQNERRTEPTKRKSPPRH